LNVLNILFVVVLGAKNENKTVAKPQATVSTNPVNVPSSSSSQSINLPVYNNNNNNNTHMNNSVSNTSLASVKTMPGLITNSSPAAGNANRNNSTTSITSSTSNNLSNGSGSAAIPTQITIGSSLNEMTNNLSHSASEQALAEQNAQTKQNWYLTEWFELLNGLVSCLV
jgi:hypothetical protein